MSESTELALTNSAINTAMGAEAGTMICSIVNDGDRAKAAKIYNAMNNPEHRVSDFINKTIAVQDVLIEIREILNEETGEVAKVPRVVLIDPEGTGYQATSIGIYNVVRNAFTAFGPAPWDPPLKMTIKQRPVARGSMLTADVVG